MVKKITELEKAMTAPMAPMAPMATRDYMAAMQHAAMQQVREDIRRKKSVSVLLKYFQIFSKLLLRLQWLTLETLAPYSR